MASYEKNLHKYDKPGYDKAGLGLEKLKKDKETMGRFGPGTLESDEPEEFYREYRETYGERTEDDVIEHDEDEIPY